MATSRTECTSVVVREDACKGVARTGRQRTTLARGRLSGDEKGLRCVFSGKRLSVCFAPSAESSGSEIGGAAGHGSVEPLCLALYQLCCIPSANAAPFEPIGYNA